MGYPVFASGDVLNASDMNAVGWWLVANGTVSSGTALTADSVFTSNYQNYRLVVDQISLTVGGSAIRLQFRTGGATNANANYNYGYTGYRANGTTYNTAAQNLTFAEVGVYIDTGSVELGSFIADIFSPQLTKRTRALSSGQGYEGAAGWRNGGFEFYGTTSFDGFRLALSGAGNFSCTWSLYGYR